jgi:tetratricopeptide (TPR) repeat protein
VAVCLFLLVVVVFVVTSFLNRSSAALWAARRSLSSNAPHDAGGWLEWGNRNGGAGKPEYELFDALIQNRLGFANGARDAVARAEELGATVAQLEDHTYLIEARLGDTGAAELLSENETATVPIREFFHAVVRCSMYRRRFGWGHSLLDRWKEQFPEDAAERYLRGRIFEIDGDPEKAQECYEQAIARQGIYAEAAFRLGVLHRSSGNFAEAETSFRLCLTTPYQEIARIEIADCLLLQGDAKAAQKILESVVDLKPETTLRQYLPVEVYLEDDRAAIVGATMNESLEQTDVAIELYERAVGHNPRNLDARSHLIALLRQLKRDDEAEKHQQVHRLLVEQQAKVVEILAQLEDTPDDLTLRCDLAELHMSCTSIADARIELQRIFELDEDHPRAQAILARINAPR